MEDVPAIDERVFGELRKIMFSVDKIDNQKKLQDKVENEMGKVSGILIENLRPFKEKSVKVSPWVHRDYCDVIFINLEPVISRALFVMQNCSINSLARYYKEIDRYINSLSLNNEAKMYLKQKVFCANSIMTPREPIIYYNDELKVVGPKDGYWVKEGMYDLNNAHRMSMSIRVGRYTEKQDVIWFINQYWDEMTEEMYGTVSKDTRVKIEKLWKIPA